MAKLYFRHGCVSSAKTLNLLAVAHNYKSQGKGVVLIKPALDDRWGAQNITSRAGLHQEADILVKEDTDLFNELEGETEKNSNVCCVLVDEAQFLSAKHIDQLRTITLQNKLPVIAYGLRTDFRSNLFEGSRRLMEVADTIEEVKTTCYLCNKKAVFNLKHVNGVADCTGPAVQLGAEEKYFPTCFGCYRSSLMLAKQMPVDSHWLTAEGLEEKVSLPQSQEQKAQEDVKADKGKENDEWGANKVTSIRGGSIVAVEDELQKLQVKPSSDIDTTRPASVFTPVSP